ncbi:MAG: sigma-70 family RNA polymerase sigma factor [Pseudomonadota bacterium]
MSGRGRFGSSAAGTAAASTDRIADIYRTTVESLSRMLRRNLGDGPPDPEDVAQRAYQKLLERETLDDIENVEAYLWRTARNIVFNEHRSQTVRNRYDYELEQLFFVADGADSNPERVVSGREQLLLIRQTLAAMPERRRRIFILHRVEGLSIAAAGRALGIGPTAARKHIARAMTDLDERLKDYRG